MKSVGKGCIGAKSPTARSWWNNFVVSGAITVVHVDLRPDADLESEALTWLDEAERSRWGRYLPEPRRRFVLCRSALRSVLCSTLGCQNGRLSFRESDNGKPFALVEGSVASISFNVSHSGDHGLIAHGPTGRLGVDIEEIVPRRHLKSLIEGVMGPEEEAELGTLQGRERLRQFYRLWTCKEALIKALGTGFSTDISRLQMPANMRWGETAGTFRFQHLPSVAWRLEDIGNEEFAAALAYELPA